MTRIRGGCAAGAAEAPIEKKNGEAAHSRSRARGISERRVGTMALHELAWITRPPTLLFADSHSLGSEGHDDVFPLSLGMLALALLSYVLHTHSSAQAQGSVHVSTSAAVAALQPCQYET